jgi:hypothetical protein
MPRTDYFSAHHKLLYLFVLAVALAFTMAGLSPSALPPLPRYDFQPGQKLIYVGKTQVDRIGEGGGFRINETLSIVVLGRSDDGRYRLLLDLTRIFRNVTPDGEVVPQDSRRELAWVEIDADGTLQPHPAHIMGPNPATLLIRFPKDDAELAAGWTADYPELGASFQCRVVDADADGFVIETVDRSTMNAVYEVEIANRLRFKSGQSYPSSLKSTGKQRWGMESTIVTEFNLVGIEQLDTDRTRRIADDAERYFAYFKNKLSMQEKLQNANERPGDDLAAFEKLIASTAEAMLSDTFRDVMAHEASVWERGRDYFLNSGDGLSAIVGKPAPRLEPPGRGRQDP